LWQVWVKKIQNQHNTGPVKILKFIMEVVTDDEWRILMAILLALLLLKVK